MSGHEHRHPPVDVLCEEGTALAGELLVRSPAVGIYGRAPRVGEVLVGGSKVGELTVLGRTVVLFLPVGCSGRVVDRMPRAGREPVEYGQLLLRLAPVEAGAASTVGASAAGPLAADLPDGAFAVTSPTHGMFYRRPSTDAPVYVEEGEVVEAGATLALVEVMKCFSAIAYGGKGLPPRARVLEVRAADGAEVRADQVLFVLTGV